MSTPVDAIVDGGNTHYADDIRRAQELARARNRVPRLRDERRHLRARARLLPDGRRRRREPSRRLEPVFASLAPGLEATARHVPAQLR